MNTSSAITQLFQGRLEREKVPGKTIMFAWSGVSVMGLKVWWERRSSGKKLKRELLKFIKFTQPPSHEYLSGLQPGDTCQGLANTVDSGVAYSQASRNPRGQVSASCCPGLRKPCMLKKHRKSLYFCIEICLLFFLETCHSLGLFFFRFC